MSPWLIVVAVPALLLGFGLVLLLVSFLRGSRRGIVWGLVMIGLGATAWAAILLA
jgi:hypothetical protein